MWCHTSSCAILDICMGWDVHVTWRWKIWKPERKERKVAQNELSPRGPCWINARGVPHSMAFHGIPCAPKFTIPGRCCSWHGTNCTPDFFHICQGLYWDCQLGWRDQPEDQNGRGGVEGAWGPWGCKVCEQMVTSWPGDTVAATNCCSYHPSAVAIWLHVAWAATFCHLLGSFQGF